MTRTPIYSLALLLNSCQAPAPPTVAPQPSPTVVTRLQGSGPALVSLQVGAVEMAILELGTCSLTITGEGLTAGWTDESATREILRETKRDTLGAVCTTSRGRK